MRWNFYKNQILLLVGCLLMSGCIKKINLYQGDKDDDDGKGNGNGSIERRDVISETEFIYPFGEESNSNEVKLKIHLKPSTERTNMDNLRAEIPPLKYNKKWLFMMTQDDCMQSAFSYTWAAIHGKPLSNIHYYDLAHLQEKDLPPDAYFLNKTLAFTDGTKREDGTKQEVRFSFTTTVSAEEDFMNGKTWVQNGYTRDDFRFRRKSGLVWGNLQEMMNYGVGIAFHDLLFEKDEVKTVEKLLDHFGKAQIIIGNKLNKRACKMLAEPNGEKIYTEAAKQYEPVSILTAQNRGVTIYPFNNNMSTSSDLKNTIIERSFYSEKPENVKSAILEELDKPKEKRKAIYLGVHNTDTGWIKFLEWLNDNYGHGEKADDSMWFANQEEFYEYNYYKQRCSPMIVQNPTDTNVLELTMRLDGEADFYYPSVTINVSGVNIEDIERIESNDDVTGLSYGNYENGIMINIDCRKFLAEHAENFVKRYEANPSDASAKADGIYFVNMLKESSKKEELMKRIK